MIIQFVNVIIIIIIIIIIINVIIIYLLRQELLVLNVNDFSRGDKINHSVLGDDNFRIKFALT